MDKNVIQYRWMEADEVTKVREIDRSERTRTGYKMVGSELQRMEVNWDSPPWRGEGEGEHSVAGQISHCRDHLRRNGRMYGAFDGEKLIGIGIIQERIGEGMAQLAYLHVSSGYRQKGVGGRIAAVLIREAKRSGAGKMYVSAIPSGSAIGFYLSQGFTPVATPIPELFELEPDDIHMTKDI
jgi:GNAT superfamily N-acetyltransferase